MVSLKGIEESSALIDGFMSLYHSYLIFLRLSVGVSMYFHVRRNTYTKEKSADDYSLRCHLYTMQASTKKPRERGEKSIA